MSAISLKMRIAARFLASLFNGVGTRARKDGLATYIDLDFSQFGTLSSFNPAAESVLAYSSVDGSYALIPISVIVSSSLTEQDISSGATVNVAAADGTIKINKTVGSATTVNLPASSTKIGPVKIVDWKGDAGTNNITINCVGADKFNGNLSSWTIAADGGSVVCTPLRDRTGYAI